MHAVDDVDRFVERRERNDRRDGSEDLFLLDPHSRFHVREHGRLDEPAFRVIAFRQSVSAAGERGLVVVLADLDVAEDLLHRVFVDNRADLGFRIEPVADAQAL